jgi:hypothetical protein
LSEDKNNGRGQKREKTKRKNWRMFADGNIFQFFFLYFLGKKFNMPRY